MPQVTVYIKREDMDRWASVEYKAEFIRRALDSELGGITKPIKQKPTGGVPKKSSVDIQLEKIESVKQMVPGILTAADLAPKIKERGACRKCGAILDIRGNCMQKGCK
jgi:hypothetical protein